MLYFPDQTKPYYLQTDASHYAIDAVLYQQDLDDVKIIACGSRTLRLLSLHPLPVPLPRRRDGFPFP